MNRDDLVLPFHRVRLTDVGRVGGKNASLGELIQSLGSAGIQVPDGFAITAAAFRAQLAQRETIMLNVDFAVFLADLGLDSISVTPDAFAGVVTRLKVE